MNNLRLAVYSYNKCIYLDASTVELAFSEYKVYMKIAFCCIVDPKKCPTHELLTRWILNHFELFTVAILKWNVYEVFTFRNI